MKTKKIFTTILLAVILLLSSVLLFACGDKSSSAQAYTEYSKLLSDFKQDTAIFKEETIMGLPTDLYIKDLASKNSSNEKVYEYNYILALSSVGLEYIEENIQKLDGLKVNASYSGLVNDAKNLRKSYNNLKTEHENLLSADGYDYRIYNGHFARYKTQVLEFVNQIFDSALSLGNFLHDKAKLAKDIGSVEMTVEALNFYCDYNVIKIFDDFRIFYINSCEGVKNSLDYFKDMVELQKNYTALYTKSYKALEQEDMKSLQTLFDRINNDRKLGQKSFKEFSYYKFSTTYNNSIDAYQNSNENATLYYNMTINYAVTLSKLYNYLNVNVIA